MIASTPRVYWFFDFISPFAYLQWQTIRSWNKYPIHYRPLLFAGLLDRLNHKGPAEIASKRLFTYRHVLWRAREAGTLLKFPPAHPFNPLVALRTCLAAGGAREAIDAIFNHIWRDGMACDTWESLAPVARRLGLSQPIQQAALDASKVELRRNFDQAADAGVFGVPSLLVNGQIFWGEDSTAMFEAYMRDSALFDSPEMSRLVDLPIAAARAGAK